MMEICTIYEKLFRIYFQIYFIIISSFVIISKLLHTYTLQLVDYRDDCGSVGDKCPAVFSDSSEASDHTYQRVLNETTLVVKNLQAYSLYELYIRTTQDGSESFSQPSNVVRIRTRPGGNNCHVVVKYFGFPFNDEIFSYW